MRLAFRELQRTSARSNVLPKQAWAVALGEDAAGVPLHCWVLLGDGKALVSFDDAATVAGRIPSVREVYGLSPAQSRIRLARLIVDGCDLCRRSTICSRSASTHCGPSSSASSARPACA